MNRIMRLIRNPYKLKYNIYKRFFIRNVSDKAYLEALYAAAFGKKLNLEAPVTYNEKLQWLKLYDRNPEYTSLVDKYDVKAIVAAIIGEDYIIETYGIYNSFEQIDFSTLPNKFVLKCTHDSGSIVICNNKEDLSFADSRKKLEKRLHNNPFWDSREWPYKNVQPRIICEKLLENDDKSEILDYKFMCFNGEPKCVFICSNRLENNLCVDFYDMEWNHMPFQRHYPNNPKAFAKPLNFNLMIELSKKLSAGKPHVRVDFYEVNGKVYFGELTFFPGSGVEEFSPESYDELFGSWINLPEK